MRVQQVQPLLFMDDKHIELEKMHFHMSEYDEAWLQALLHEHPSLLPVGDVEPEFGGLISLGREIDVGGVYVDNLFINSRGFMTIVETKLWRNPEAMREVVAQMLDYAGKISRWSFEDLNKAVSKANQGKSLLQIVSEGGRWDPESEIAFVDAVNRYLPLGRFLLMVVGDGIRHNVEQMLGNLNRSPHLRFTFSMAEMQVFKTVYNGKEIRAVFPQIRVKTSEVVRGVVEIKVTQEVPGVKVETSVADFVQEQSPQRRRTLARQDFYDLLHPKIGEDEVKKLDGLLAECVNMDLQVVERESSVVVKIQGRSDRTFSMVEWHKDGTVYVSGYFSFKIQYAGLPKELTQRFFQRMSPIFSGQLPQGYKVKGVPIPEITAKSEELLKALQDTAEDVTRELARQED